MIYKWQWYRDRKSKICESLREKGKAKREEKNITDSKSGEI